MTKTANGTVAELVARSCAARGVKRAFGVPGGGSSLDLIEAFGRHGIDFVLCRTETGAVLMAAADAELRGGFGVALATQGPGAASAMNGLAHASLDRAPVLFVSDGWTPAQRTIDSHQVFDQAAMSAPVVKASSRLEGDHPALELQAVIDAMLAPPWGPAHLVLTGENARRLVDSAPSSAAPASATEPAHALPAQQLLQQALRPVLLAGLELREPGAVAMLERLAAQLQCPVLTTYKAKGLVGDESPWVVGQVTGGALERPCIEQADLIVRCGLDPVELIGRPWPYRAPVLELGLCRHHPPVVEAAATLHGPLAAGLAALGAAARPSLWTTDEVARLRADMRERLAVPGSGAALGPQAVVETALAVASRGAASAWPSVTVDAGAHMFSAMGFWRARPDSGVLISNGLATMGFALPAAMARALADPQRPTIAFTGDGGLMMCAGELATAAQAGARLCVVVFNDGALSLIALKQRARGLAAAGVGWDRADFASVARGFGLAAWRVDTVTDYAAALQAALAHHGPSLIDVHVDPSGYPAQARALRG